MNYYKNIFADLLRSDKGVPGLLAIIVALFSISAVVISTYLRVDLYVMAAFISLPLFFLIITYPKLWLYTVVLLFFVFFSPTDKEVNPMEILVGLLYNGGLLVWLVWTVFVKKIKIVDNIADWLILFLYVVILFGNSTVAFLNGTSLSDWIREVLVFSLTLFYFPFKYYFTDKKDLITLLIVLGITIFFIDLKQFYYYYSRLTSNALQYAYELGGSVSVNQTLFTLASIFGFLFAFSRKKLSHEFIFILFTAVSVSALVTTFSRTFWLILIAALIAMFIFFPIRKKIKMTVYIGIMSVLFVGAAFLFARDNLFLYANILEKRLTSTTKGRSDISLQSRIFEWEAVGNSLEHSFLAGNGFSSKFHFYNPITETTKRTNTIHNGYLFFLYRMGLPLTLIYLFFFTYYTYKSFILLKLVKDPFFKVLISATFGCMIVMFLVNITSSQFMYRDGIFAVALLVALVSITEKNYLQGKA